MGDVRESEFPTCGAWEFAAAPLPEKHFASSASSELAGAARGRDDCPCEKKPRAPGVRVRVLEECVCHGGVRVPCPAPGHALGWLLCVLWVCSLVAPGSPQSVEMWCVTPLGEVVTTSHLHLFRRGQTREELAT